MMRFWTTSTVRALMDANRGQTGRVGDDCADTRHLWVVPWTCRRRVVVAWEREGEDVTAVPRFGLKAVAGEVPHEENSTAGAGGFQDFASTMVR